MTEKLDSTKSALVDKDAYWKRITPDTPRGKKMFLINKTAGSATYGSIAGNEKFFTHYFPLPVFDPNED